jgi:mannosyltransferase
MAQRAAVASAQAMVSTGQTAPAHAPTGARLPGARAMPPAAAGALLVVLVAWSLVLRTEAIGGSYWIDEGIAVGIASHPLGQIPALLQQDGSPPL